MADKPTDLNILDPRNVLKVNATPVQRPGTDLMLRTATLGGPDKPGDRRVYLSAKLLAQMLDIARTSSMGRVQIDSAGLRVDLYQAGDGHQYEVWTLIGAPPKPEQMPVALRSLGAGN